MIKVACVQMKDIVNFICLNKKILKIKNKKGNFWRKRNINDGKIDWRMPSEAIKSLVNALSWPYIGAHFLFNSKNFKGHSVKIINNKEKNNKRVCQKSFGRLRLGANIDIVACYSYSLF